MVPAPVLPEDLFECGICRELLLEPVTLSCCGRSFCRDCLRSLLQSAVHTGVARCPGGCDGVVPFRLPPRSYLLQRCLEAAAPEELERRQREAEDELALAQPIPGGFEAWSEVAASQDLRIDPQIVVGFGTPGIVVGPAAGKEDRVRVMFDTRLDFQRGHIDVKPFELIKQLPSHFGVKIGESVVAVQDLHHDVTLMAPLGTRGVALRQHGEIRIVVQFDRRVDGSHLPINVLYSEVMPHRKLLGGYDVGQRVEAAMDLFADETLMVRSGVQGVVMCEYSSSRLTVKFDERADGRPNAVNVIPCEIRALPPPPPSAQQPDPPEEGP